MNEAGAVWWLTVQLWIGGPYVSEGPYTEARCIAIADEWDRGAVAYMTRNRLKKRPSWVCFPGKPAGPNVYFFPSQYIQIR